VPTLDEVAAADILEGRRFDGAFLGREGATRMEAATGGRVE
jgi:hypothetical protein